MTEKHKKPPVFRFSWKTRVLSLFLLTKWICSHTLSGAFPAPWTFPRAKNSPPDCFCTSLRTGAALSCPANEKENGHPKMSVSFWWARRDLNSKVFVLSPVKVRYFPLFYLVFQTFRVVLCYRFPFRIIL